MAHQFQENIPIQTPGLATPIGPRAADSPASQLLPTHSLYPQLFEEFSSAPLSYAYSTPESQISDTFSDTDIDSAGFLTGSVYEPPVQGRGLNTSLYEDPFMNEVYGQYHIEPFQNSCDAYSPFFQAHKCDAQPEANSTWTQNDVPVKPSHNPGLDISREGPSAMKPLSEAPKFYQCQYCFEGFPDRHRCEYVSNPTKYSGACYLQGVTGNMS